MDDIDLYKFNLTDIKKMLINYKSIVDTHNNIVLIEYNGILPLVNDILGDVVDTVYFKINFSDLYHTNISDLHLDKIIITDRSILYKDNLVIKLKNGNLVFLNGTIQLLKINDHSI